MTRVESVQYNSDAPLAFCPVHGLFVASGAARAGTNARLIIQNVATNCPICNCASEVLPGLYAPDGDSIRLLLDPSASTEALDALRKIIESVQAGKITPEQAGAEAEKVKPGWGKLFNVAGWSTNSVTLAVAMLGLIGVIANAKLSAPPTVIVNVPPAIVQTVTPARRHLLGSTAMTHPHAIPHSRAPHPHHDEKRR
jgi:hypothetical protein